MKASLFLLSKRERVRVCSQTKHITGFELRTKFSTTFFLNEYNTSLLSKIKIIIMLIYFAWYNFQIYPGLGKLVPKSIEWDGSSMCPPWLLEILACESLNLHGNKDRHYWLRRAFWYVDAWTNLYSFKWPHKLVRIANFCKLKKMEFLPSNVCGVLMVWLEISDIQNCSLLNKHLRKVLSRKNKSFWKSVLIEYSQNSPVLRLLEKNIKIEGFTDDFFYLYKLIKGSNPKIKYETQIWTFKNSHFEYNLLELIHSIDLNWTFELLRRINRYTNLIWWWWTTQTNLS